MDTQKRILLIGRNQRVLEKLAQALGQEGYVVDTTNQIEKAVKQFNAASFDLVAFGRGVDQETNQVLRTAFSEQNPDVVFVDGLAPVIPLLVKQIKNALANRNGQAPKTLVHFSYEQSKEVLIRVIVATACQLTIDLYELDARHTTEQERLVDERVEVGSHQFVIDKPIKTDSHIRFLVAEIDDRELSVLPLQE